MYSTFNYEIAKARIADIHQDARRDAQGRAARAGRTRKPRSARPAPKLPFLAVRRVLTALGAHT